MTDASPLSLTAQVDETDVLLVNAGVPATAELDAVPGATYAAAVTTVDPTPTTSTPRRRDLPRAALVRGRARRRRGGGTHARARDERGRAAARPDGARRAWPRRCRRSSATASATRCGW